MVEPDAHNVPAAGSSPAPTTTLEYDVTPQMFRSLGGPDGLVRKMKELGFRFTSEQCPVKLAQPSEVVEQPHGGVLYRQKVATQ